MGTTLNYERRSGTLPGGGYTDINHGTAALGHKDTDVMSTGGDQGNE